MFYSGFNLYVMKLKLFADPSLVIIALYLICLIHTLV